MPKVFTIGSATVDVFVECDDTKVVSVMSKDASHDYMSYPYGAKLDMSDFSSNVGGGGVNTAFNFANLGFDTSVIFKIGEDIYSEGILKSFKKTNIDLSSIIQDKKSSTGFSIILVSFQGDRTVLAHRGTNAQIKEKEINFNDLKNADLLYIAPLNGESNKVLVPLVDFAKKNDIKVCFNAGTTSLHKGWHYIKEVLKEVHVVVMNKEEASICTEIFVRPDTKDKAYSDELIHPDVKHMLKKLKVKDYQIVVITDGGKGAYAYNGKSFYYCPVFESKVVSTLGAGDSFASTFCAALYKTKNIKDALKYAAVNSASVVSKFSATEGILSFGEIEKHLAKNPDFKCIEVEK